MICSDIRSARDSPAHPPAPSTLVSCITPEPWIALKQVVQSQGLLFSYKIRFLVVGFLLFLTERGKQPILAFGFVHNLCVAET